VEFKVTEDMSLNGPLSEIALPESCKIMIVNRAGEMSIPEKYGRVHSGDHLLLLCDSKVLPVLKTVLHEDARTHKVLIVGGGMVGFYLASRLEKMGLDVKLIEADQDRCQEIADELPGTMILNGDGTDITLLKEEAAGGMDVVFAVTGVDEKNLLCSLLVKQLGAKKILSRVNRSSYIKLFEMVGVDRALSPGQVTADAVLQRVIGGEEVITLSDERIELVDFVVKSGSKIKGKVLSKELPENAMSGLVLRDGKTIVPENGFKVQEGDRVFVVAMPHAISKVKKLFVS
jgi:trk system potassium uptake protein TrkA